MALNALLEKELLEQANRRRSYGLRLGYVVGLYSLYCMQFFTLQGGSGMSGLGQGHALFQTTMAVQWIAILAILPALACTLITTERERNTLDLLILTRMGLAHIILQKYFSRLIPVFGFLLAGLPLHAISFRSGGISTPEFWDATFMQVGALFLIGSTSLASSAQARNSSSAMTTAFAYALFVGLELWVLHDKVTATQLLCIQLVLSIIVLVVTWVYLRKNPQGPADRSEDKKAQAAASFTPGLALADAMQNAPIAWRELRKLNRHNSWSRKYLFTIELGMALFFLALIAAGETLNSHLLFYKNIPIAFFWYFAVVRLTFLTVNTVARERTDQTLDALLTSNLDGFQILYQKMIVVHQYIQGLWLPFGVYYFGRALLMGWFTHTDLSIFIIPYLVLGALCVWIYLPLFMWLAMWVGLKVPNRNRAIMITLGIIMVGSEILNGMVKLLSQVMGFGAHIIAIPALLSPMAFIRRIEELIHYHNINGIIPMFSTILFSGIAFWLYAKVSRRLQQACTTNADNLLRSDYT